MANEFLSPYAVGKVLEGVIPALPKIRPNYLQGALASGFVTRETPTINFDKEFAVKNTVAMFVHHLSDVTPIQLGDFGTTELYFAYSKEGWDDDEFDVIYQRQIGQQFGIVNPLANQAQRLLAKATLAEQRFENLFEKTWAEICLYGGYKAVSEKHPPMLYDFGRTVATTYAQLTGKLVPAANLTTAAVVAPWGTTIMPVIGTSGGFTQGDKKWTKANVTAGKATPILDLIKMAQTSRRYGSTALQSFIVQPDAYEVLEFDIKTNYPDAADLTIATILSTKLQGLPPAREIDGMTMMRYWDFGNGDVVPIYVYEAIYNDRDTGAETRFVPDGWVLGIPAASHGIKVYGRIKHPRANYAAMPRWINRWMEEKTAVNEFEEHTSFLIGHTRINALTAWKVC